MTTPTARALDVLDALQDHPGISADALARRVGVTDRAARRYVRLLREAGIPVESTPGRYGGYRLGRGTRLPPLRLSGAEALGLVMAALAGGATDESVGNAISKITRVLPAAIAESVAAIRTLRVAQTGSVGVMPDPETVAALARAADTHHRVRLGYQLKEERQMTVDPWAVAVWRGRWYVIGWSHRVDERRVLRLDRVRRVEVLDDRFDPPAGLDPIAAIEEHMSTGWPYEVEVLIDAPLEQVTWWLPRQLGRLEATDTGTRLRGSTENVYWYAHRLTEIRAPYRIVGPEEVRVAARHVAARLAAAAE